MNRLIKKIMNIMGDHWSSCLKISIDQDEIYFGIYDSEVPIVIDVHKQEVYLDCEGVSTYLTSDMLHELYQITALLERNVETIVDLVPKKENKNE